MRKRIAIIYNEPYPSRYDTAGEEKAVLGVLDAVATVNQALLELGYDTVRLSLSPPFEQAKKKLCSLDVDLVFNLFEGFCGYPETEALIPEALLELEIPFTGCPGAVLRQALDKAKVKVILKAAGILTPDFQLLNHQTLHMFRLDYPCIVKPRHEDASHGLTEQSVVSNFTLLKKQVKAISDSYGGSALVEEFVDGREFNATVLGNSQVTVLPVSEIDYSLPSEMPRILTFAAKWGPDSIYFQNTRVICPAGVGTDDRQRITETSTAVFKLLGCRGYVRVDMRMDRNGRLHVIEVNPNPDISADSGAARQAKAVGMTYNMFIGRIVQLAMEYKCFDHKNPPHATKRQTELDENIAEYARIQAV